MSRCSATVNKVAEEVKLVRVQVGKLNTTLPQLAGSNKVARFYRTVPGIVAWNGFNKTVIGYQVYFEFYIVKLPVFRIMICYFGSTQRDIRHRPYDFRGRRNEDSNYPAGHGYPFVLAALLVFRAVGHGETPLYLALIIYYRPLNLSSFFGMALVAAVAFCRQARPPAKGLGKSYGK